MKKTIVSIIFFVSACSNSVATFSPSGSNLPDGVVGRSYFGEIEITNAIIFKENIGVDISPIGSGLKWNPEVNTLKRGGRKERRKTTIT